MRKSALITGPAYWASALINGDNSGLMAGEREIIEAWLEQHCGTYWSIVDVARHANGEAREASFSNSYDLHAGPLADPTITGGDVLDYVAIRRAGARPSKRG